MAKVGRKPQVNIKPTVANITCLSCGDIKKSSEFYISSSVFNAGTGRVQYCIKCCMNMSCDDDGNIDIDKFKTTLEKIDKPFLPDILQSAYEQSKNDISDKGKETHPLSLYFKNINSLKQYKTLTWKDSKVDKHNDNENNKRITSSKSSNFKLTDDIIELFGAGYKKEEYQAMWRKYNFLKNNYKTKTNMHIEALASYVRFKVKEEFAVSSGEVTEAEKWAKLANSAATAAKINPQQLSAADLSEGLSTVSQISKAVEQVKDIISILPKYKQEPQDIVDFTIWSYVNYERDLNGKPLCSYEEMYKFYDKMVSDNMTRYSFLKKDITKQGRENAKSFIESNEEVNDEDSLEEGEDIAEELSD